LRASHGFPGHDALPAAGNTHAAHGSGCGYPHPQSEIEEMLRKIIAALPDFFTIFLLAGLGLGR
jgi:hypothetical protein